jgi:hypothetical protein
MCAIAVPDMGWFTIIEDPTGAALRILETEEIKPVVKSVKSFFVSGSSCVFVDRPPGKL